MQKGAGQSLTGFRAVSAQFCGQLLPILAHSCPEGHFAPPLLRRPGTLGQQIPFFRQRPMILRSERESRACLRTSLPGQPHEAAPGCAMRFGCARDRTEFSKSDFSSTCVPAESICPYDKYCQARRTGLIIYDRGLRLVRKTFVPSDLRFRKFRIRGYVKNPKSPRPPARAPCKAPVAAACRRTMGEGPGGEGFSRLFRLPPFPVLVRYGMGQDTFCVFAERTRSPLPHWERGWG